MAKTYEQLQRQIQALQAEADKLRRQELDGVIARIREAVAFYELTPADLGFGGPGLKVAARKTGPRKQAAVKKAATAAAPAVAFSNGTGGTWGGRGKRPQWLRDAVLAGHSVEEFRVKAA